MSGKRSSPRSSRPSPQQAEAAAGLVEVVASSMTVIDEFEISEGELHTCPAPRCSASFNSFAKLEAHLSESQFEQVLGMARHTFYELTKMEQMRIKQDVGLF